MLGRRRSDFASDHHLLIDESLPQKSEIILGIGSVQGAVATWSKHGSQNRYGDIAC